MRYPEAVRGPVVDDLHGHLVPDPYRWLEDADAAPTRAWLDAQADLWRTYAGRLADREAFHRRVAELADVGLVSAPVWRGNRRFWLSQRPGQEHAVVRVAGAADGDGATLLDPMALDPTGLTTLDAWHPDRTGERVAYQVSRHGAERAELYVLDVATGRRLDGPIDRCRYSPVVWQPDGGSFFYVRSLPGHSTRHRRVYLHRVGSPAGSDALVFGAGHDETTRFGLGGSDDGRWLVISASVGSASGNELWLVEVSTGGLRLVHRDPDARAVAHVDRNGRLYLLTTLGAPQGRLCVADAADPRPAGWRDLVPADPDAALSDVVVLDGPRLDRPVLLVARIRRAVGELTVHDLADGRLRQRIRLPGAGHVGQLTARPDGHEAWFTYTDSVTPPTVYRVDARTGASGVWATPPGTADLPAVESRELTCVSTDGTPVPVTVISRPGGTGPRPTILYGYGGFGAPTTPTYSAYVLAWVAAGGVFALAHLRGGGGHGAHWHRDGRLDRKQNVVDDFVAVAEGLIRTGWTTAGLLGACGESNGGLVVGAAITQRPELFAAAVCSAPLLDMVRYERSGMGTAWRAEYGSAEDPDQLGRLLAYSPYHRVRERVGYPAVLFTVFDGDTRVDPMHARKMCAALQWATKHANPVLLRTEGGVGHGARGAGRAVGLAADILAFTAAQTGLTLGREAREAGEAL